MIEVAEVALTELVGGGGRAAARKNEGGEGFP